MDVLAQVKEILGKRIDITTIKEDDKLSNLGLDSLDLVEVMMELEEELNIEFSSDEIANVVTLKDVKDLIETKCK